MKTQLSLLALLAFAISPAAHAVDVIKANNTNDLNLDSSWEGGTAPTSDDRAVWGSASGSGGRTYDMGDDLNWNGVAYISAASNGTVTINNDGFTLTVGSQGLSIQGSSRTLNINPNVVLTANQSFFSGGGGTLNVNGNVDTAAGFTITFSGGNSKTLSGVVSGAGGLTYGSSATSQATLSNTNTYTGATTLNGGVFALTAADAIATSSGVSFSGSDNPSLRLAGDPGIHQQVASLTSTVANSFVEARGAAGQTKILTIAPASGTFSFAGVLRDDTTANANVLAVTKSGGGTQTLTGTNTYTGDTTITGGTLALGLAGSIANSTLVDIRAGAEFDTTTKTGDFTMLGSQTFRFTLNGAGAGTAGLLDATGLDITNGVVDFATIGTLDDAAYVIANYTTLTGTQFASGTAPSGYTIDYNYQGLNQIAVVVPEPGTFAMMLGGLGMLMVLRRRVRRP